jgi:serralysin
MSDAYGIGWSDQQKADFAAAMSAFESVANLDISIANSDAEADMIQYRVTPQQFSAAFPTSPYGPYSSGWAGYHWGPTDEHPARAYYDSAQINQWLIYHELGHGLGLEHPHTVIHGAGLFPGVSINSGGDTGTYDLNTTFSTMMSYNYKAYTTLLDGPMAGDIAALQHLYGANMNTGIGDDTYTVARPMWRSIWDVGGIDWLLAGSDAGATLDLRPASLKIEPYGLGYKSSATGFTGGFTVAYGVDIENARGGTGNDVLAGNQLQNILDGGAGNDTYVTDDPNDTILDESGNDTLTSNISRSLAGYPMLENLFLAGSVAINGTGNDLDNILTGNTGANTLSGEDGNDRLWGRKGKDRLTGGAGKDTFEYKYVNESLPGTDRDIIIDFVRGTDVINLKAIDANTKASGNNTFKFIGKGAFSKTAGELRYTAGTSGATIHADVNGDGTGDFQVSVSGVSVLSAANFVL